jgi:hypothetical protein
MIRVKAQTIDLPPLCFRAELGEANPDMRTVELIFSTGAPVERFDWYSGKRYIEKLSLDPAHVRLDRLNAGASLLDTHSAWSVSDVLGAVVEGSARLEKGKGLARVRFSKREAVEPIFQDVLDRIIRHVSIGYQTYKYEEIEGKGNKLPVRTAIDWEPFEISMVPMPADAGAHTRDGGKSLTTRCVILASASTLTDADRLRRLQLARARY